MPKKDQRKKNKRWVFTINNFGSGDVIRLRNLGRRIGRRADPPTCQPLPELVSYLIFARETGDSGTRHLQGYVEFRNRQRLSGIKRHIGARAHAEISRGSPIEASMYCRKDGDYEEFGIRMSGRTGRTDLDDVRRQIVSGAREADIADQYFALWCQYRRSFARYRSLLSHPRDFATEVVIYWGRTGTGKTRRVVEDEEDLWIAPDNQLMWFDGYSGQKAVLFDDFVSCKAAKFGFLLQITDRYPLQVPVKGGFVNWRPERIYFTSNLSPEDWYVGATTEQKEAFRRRVDREEYFE